MRGGYGKEASVFILHHGFVRMNLERIYCGTSEDNMSMKNLFKYMLMAKEGIRRKAIFVNDQYRDIYDYGLLKSEYLARHDHKNKFQQ